MKALLRLVHVRDYLLRTQREGDATDAAIWIIDHAVRRVVDAHRRERVNSAAS